MRVTAAAALVRKRSQLSQFGRWAFWRSFLSESEALDAYLLIRAYLAPERDEQANRNLLARLVNTGRYSEAFALYDEVSPSRSDDDTPFVADYPPIDWQVSSSRDARARLNGSGSFEIFVEQNAAGELARRLATLKDGTYSLESRLDLRQGTDDITANLECLSGRISGNLTTSLIASDDWQFVAQGCDFAWLIIKRSAWDNSVPLETTLSHISLEDPR